MIHLPDPAPPQPTDPSGRSLVLRVLLATSIAVAAAVISWWPRWGGHTSTGMVHVLVAGSLAATAAVLYEDLEQRPTAREIGLAAALYLTGWWWAWPPQWHVGPLPLVSFHVRAELRRALRDPDLQLWRRRQAEHTYLDADDTPAEPIVDQERCLVTVRSSDDLPLAVIGMRLSLRRHGKLVESAAHTTGMVLERLAKLEEVQASRADLTRPS